MTIDAILWDYDGTMINSVRKNISITRAIIEEVAPRLSGIHLPHALNSPSRYQVANHAAENWRDLYLNYYGLSAEETDAAGHLWSSHQLANKTPVSVFDGIADTVRSLGHVPQGICSQNSAENIQQVLSDHDIDHHIDQIIGYDDVPYDSQKPAPDAGLLCLTRMFASVETISMLYVGDHEADTVFARNLQMRLGTEAKVLAVAVTYSGARPDSWTHKPDWTIDSPFELVEHLSNLAN
jgi:phosphoglycolate phosphatase-like HAD superfamily hydrolase